MDDGSPLDRVVVCAVSPSSVAVQWCLDQYFEELDKRLPGDFDRVAVLLDQKAASS